MKTRTILILAFLATVATIAWWSLRSPIVSAAEIQTKGSLFAPEEIPLERVNSVEIRRNGLPTFTFTRDANGWAQRAPFLHPADAASIREVIDVAAALSTSRTLDPKSIESDAQQAMGLDGSASKFTLGWDGGSRTITLGKRTIAGRAWAQVEGRAEIASVDASLHTIIIDGDPRQWRSMQLYQPQSADIACIEIRYGATASQKLLLKRSAGKWRLDSPVNTRADAEAIRGYLEGLSRTQADGFLADSPDDLAPFGLLQPSRSVRIFPAGIDGVSTSPAGEIEVGEPVASGTTERFARISSRPVVVQLGSQALTALFPPPAFFVDPRGSDAVPADVRAIIFTPVAMDGAALPTASFRLDRTLEGWSQTVAAEAPRPADAERVRRLLGQLCEARAPAVAFQIMPDALQVGTFTLLGIKDAMLSQVRVAHEPNGQWAIDNADGVLRVFPAGFELATDARIYAGNR